MPSLIDVNVPPEGNATTAAVRANFAQTKLEIEQLQVADLSEAIDRDAAIAAAIAALPPPTGASIAYVDASDAAEALARTNADAAEVTARNNAIAAAIAALPPPTGASVAYVDAADAAEVTARNTAITNAINAIPTHATPADVTAAVATEATARDAAILIETNARTAADAAEVTARNNAIAAEATARDAAILVEFNARVAAIAQEVIDRNAAIAAAGGGGGGPPLINPSFLAPPTGYKNLINPYACTFATQTQNAAVMMYFPFMLQKTITFTKVGMHLMTTINGTLKIGFYTNTLRSGHDQPTNLIAALSVDISTLNSGLQEGTIPSTTLQANTLYWCGYQMSAAVSLRAPAVASPTALLGYNGIAYGSSYSESRVFAALPAVASTTLVVNSQQAPLTTLAA